jgi:hypothetical protein
MEVAYYRFETLPKTVRESNRIVSKSRLDCTYHYSNGYKGIEPFKSPRNNQFFINIVDASNYITKRVSEDTITSRGINLSSMIKDFEDCLISYGYPNKQIHLKNGRLNPLREFKDDAYLFVYNNDKTVLEMLVFPNEKENVENIYYEFINGYSDFDLEEIRDKAEIFYNYFWYQTSTQPDLITNL